MCQIWQYGRRVISELRKSRVRATGKQIRTLLTPQFFTLYILEILTYASLPPFPFVYKLDFVSEFIFFDSQIIKALKGHVDIVVKRMDSDPDFGLVLPASFVTLGRLLVAYGSPFSHL